MKKIRLLLLLSILFTTNPLSVKADDFIRLNVGDKRTIDLPYEYKSKNGYGTWYSDTEKEYLKYVGSTRDVEVEIKKYTSSTCHIRYSYSYWENGSSYTKIYTLSIDINKPTVSIVADPSGGKVEKGTIVYLSCPEHSDARIYYSTNGYNPSTSGYGYSNWTQVRIEETCTLKAVASWGGVDSDVLTEEYTVAGDKLTLSASPSGGTVPKGTTVYLTASEYGSDIYYTTDGSTPTKWDKYYYNGITIDENCTIKAIAYKDGYKESDVLTEYYTVSSGSDPNPEPTPTPTPTPSGTIDINATNFPDDNFRKYLLEQDYGKDGMITAEEFVNVKYIEIRNKGISNLKGIEYFTSLLRLFCNDNQLTSLDLSKNTALDDLMCDGNQLTSLDVSNNIQLERLMCGRNQLTSLNVSNNSKLRIFDCSINNLSSIDVSNNYALESLGCINNSLSSIDVSKNYSLKYLDCSNNNLTSIDVSKNYSLESLYCGNNNLTSIDVSKNYSLESLNCSNSSGSNNNNIKKLDFSNNTALSSISCSNIGLQSIDVSKNHKLKDLYCSYNEITTLNLSGSNNLLETVDCSNNELTSLNVLKNTALRKLYCYFNRIKEAEMDALIESLPQISTNEGKFYVVYTPDTDNNVCTPLQVSTAKAKGWVVYRMDRNGWGWLEYEGSDPTLIKDIQISKTKATPIYNINGLPMDKPRKGINIIGGKKVVIK